MDWGPRWCFLSYTEMLQRGELHPGPRPGRQWASATWEQSCELRGMCWTPGKQHLARAADVGFLRDFRKNVSSVPSLKCPICIFPSSSSLLRILLNSYLKCKFSWFCLQCGGGSGPCSHSQEALSPSESWHLWCVHAVAVVWFLC